MTDGALRFLQVRGDVPSGGLRMMSSGLDPLLAEALVMLRARHWTGTAGDNWDNEGTLGATGDAVPQTALGSADSDAGPPSYFNRDMFDQRYVMFSGAINEGDGDPSLASTPDSASISITGDIVMRVKGRGVPGWYGSANQAVLMRKANGADLLVQDYDLNIEDDGDVRLGWIQADTTVKGLSWTNVFEDLYVGPYDLLADLDVDNGAGGHTARLWQQDDAGSVSFAGTTWTLVSAQTGSGTTDIRDTSGVLAVGITKGWFEKAQVWSGKVGSNPTLVADFDPSDSAGENDPSWASAATGETWTVSYLDHTGVIDTATPGFVVGGATANVHGWKITDADSLDFGTTTDGTVVVKVRNFEIADTNGEQFAWANKQTGSFGAPGSAGWVIEDLKIPAPPLDFLYAGATEGTDTAAPVTNAHTTGSNLAVLTMDRDGNATFYLNGTSVGTPAAMSAVGSISTATDIIIGGWGGMLGVVESFALYNRVLTADEVTRISTLATNGVI